MLLVATAAALVVGSVAVSFGSYAFGFDDIGLLLVIESVFVFGAAFSYCGRSWPKWYERDRAVRRRILLTLSVLFVTHVAIIVFTSVVYVPSGARSLGWE